MYDKELMIRACKRMSDERLPKTVVEFQMKENWKFDDEVKELHISGYG